MVVVQATLTPKSRPAVTALDRSKVGPPPKFMLIDLETDFPSVSLQAVETMSVMLRAFCVDVVTYWPFQRCMCFRHSFASRGHQGFR